MEIVECGFTENYKIISMKKYFKNKLSYYFDAHVKELVSGSSIAFVLKVFAAILGMLLNIIITRNLGIEEAGLYFLSLTIITSAATFGRFGTDGIVVKVFSGALAIGDWGKIMGVYKSSLLIVFTISIIISILVYFVAPILSESLFNKPGLTDILRWMSFSIIPLALYTFHASALQGLKRIRDSNLVLVVIMPIFMVMGSMFFIEDYGIVGLMIVYFVSSCLTLYIGRTLWKTRVRIESVKEKYISISKLITESIPLFKVSVFGAIMSISPMIFLGVWGTESDLGGFQIASRIALLTTFVLTSVNSIFGPKLSGCFSRNESKLVYSLIIKSTVLMCFLTVPFLIILFFFPNEILLIFGDKFERYSNVLVILALGQFVNVFTGSVGQILVMSDNQKKQRNAFFVATIVSFCFGLVLVPEYGATGAAVSTTIGVVIVNLLSLFFVIRYVKLK